MPSSWTLHTLEAPFAAFTEAPNISTWMTYAMVIAVLVHVGRLGRKLDRIMKHLGLEEESPKPAPTAGKGPLQEEV